MKIICIGRNYEEHARELHNPLPKEPVFFLKPDSALLTRNRHFYYPDFSKEIHYEAEIVLNICKSGKSIPEKFAHTYYEEIGIGIDFTARDLQRKAKQKGLPWEKAKAFDHSAPISEKFIDKSQFNNLNNIGFYLEKNGEKVQQGNTGDMIFSFEKLISYVSLFISFKAGDLIFTGTPSGVGPVMQGDQLEAFIEGRSMLRCSVK